MRRLDAEPQNEIQQLFKSMTMIVTNTVLVDQTSNSVNFKKT
jgi:hypothetical protein